jgi:outer membrane protein TolC
MLSIVRAYHPILKQANLIVKKANAELLQSRGVFDPKITTDFENKSFDGKEYYSYFNPELSIPIWYGLNLKGGFEQLNGLNTDPSMTLGQSNYIGIQANTSQLIFDKRRAIVKQAQCLAKLSDVERKLQINELIYESLNAYWNWSKEYQTYQIIKQCVQLNEDRLKFIRTEFEQGNRPAIDTTEALAQLQNLYLLCNNAELVYKKAGFELSNYLWLEDGSPMIWNDQVVPSAIDNIDTNSVHNLDNYLSTALDFHPKLKSLDIKIDLLDIDRRLKFQSLLPDLGLQANLLNKGLGLTNDFSSNFYTRNNKVALSLNIPIFLRNARGGYQAAKYKLQQGKLEQDYQTFEIENKIKSYFNEVTFTAKQISIYESVYDNNRKLFVGEMTRFQIGESNLFVLNARENKLLESAQKLQELKAKWHKSFAGLHWATGILN